jgi:hypothetical protein
MLTYRKPKPSRAILILGRKRAEKLTPFGVDEGSKVALE